MVVRRYVVVIVRTIMLTAAGAAMVSPIVGLASGAPLRSSTGPGTALAVPPVDVRGGAVISTVSAVAVAVLIGVLVDQAGGRRRTAWLASVGAVVALPIVTTALVLVTGRAARLPLLTGVAIAGWIATPPFTMIDVSTGTMSSTFSLVVMVGRVVLVVLLVASLVDMAAGRRAARLACDHAAPQLSQRRAAR